MTLRAGECKVTWHSEIMNHFFLSLQTDCYYTEKQDCCVIVVHAFYVKKFLCVFASIYFFFLLIHFSLTGSQEGIDSGQRLRRQVKPALLFI